MNIIKSKNDIYLPNRIHVVSRNIRKHAALKSQNVQKLRDTRIFVEEKKKEIRRLKTLKTQPFRMVLR